MGSIVGVTLVHDYLTQRGGAERVTLSLLRAFPGSPLYTSFYEAGETFEDFRGADVRTLPLNAFGPLRRNHRLALPLLAPAFSRLALTDDVVVCSSSGWAHGVRVVGGRKLVYCHAPARWLYQRKRYLPARGAAAGGLALMRPSLTRWDRRAAASAHRYVVNSRAIRDQVAAIYGIDAEVVPPPHSLDPTARLDPVDGIEPGYVLCVSRLLPYKNVGEVVAAFAQLPTERLVVVGDGPGRAELAAYSPANVAFTETVDDAQLRWLYANARLLVAAAYEDFGLTPIEAASFGRATAALRFGGYLDTVEEGETGMFFDRPEPNAIRAAVETALARTWDEERLRRHAAAFSEDAFIRRMRKIVAEMQP